MVQLIEVVLYYLVWVGSSLWPAEATEETGNACLTTEGFGSFYISSGQDQMHILDFRTDLIREAEGWIPGSQLISLNDFVKGSLSPGDIPRPIGNDNRPVIYVTLPKYQKSVQDSLVQRGFSNLYCFTEGVVSWRLQGYPVQYPKTIQFEALNYTIHTPEEHPDFQLIDVRSRRELRETGRIPTSVNLPLQEISQAMKLSPQQFKSEYGFEKPSPEARNVVITCRSGGRARAAESILRSDFSYHYLRIYEGSFTDWTQKGGKIVV